MARGTPAVAGWLKEHTPVARRRQLAAARVRARMALAPIRSLPNALVIGAQRSGTSSLYKYLEAHPDVRASVRKEVEYFSTRHGEGERWYRAHFPIGTPGARWKVAFEATPDYLLHPLAAERAALLVPTAKIVAMLRNPVSRAISHYGHNRRLGQEPLPLGEALDAEPERLAGEYDRIAEDPDYPARSLRRYGYVERGRYAEQLRRWLVHFPDLLVVRFEDFTADPAGTLETIERYLGIEPWIPDSFRNFSYDRAGRPERPAPEAGVVDRLTSAFAEPNADLARLLGRELWSNGQP